MISGKILLSMRRAIEQRLHFHQWFKEQKEIDQDAKHEKTIAQLEYENLENEVRQDLNRLKHGKYIVTDRHGWPSEKNVFILHRSPTEAAKHGSKTLGYGKYLIKEWSRFEGTHPHKVMCALVKVQERMSRYKVILQKKNK